MSDIAERGYAKPDVLVSTDWVAAHLNDPKIRIVESNEDQLLYPSGHIPGAVQVDWAADLNDPLRRDYLNREGFEKLMSRIGATRDTAIVFYGDKSNWWATYAFWVFQLFGHTNAKVMDGGRLKWEKEGRALTREVPSYPATSYKAPERNDSQIRIFRDEVLKKLGGGTRLVDVGARRSFPRAHPHARIPAGRRDPGRPHPRREERPIARAANPGRHFRSAAELVAIYEEKQGLSPAKSFRLLQHRRT